MLFCREDHPHRPIASLVECASRDHGRPEPTGGKQVRQSNSHEPEAKDACCCVVRWATFDGLQFQMDCVGRVIALS